MFKFIVGCDISKLVFDVAYFDERPVYLGQFTNDSNGFSSLVLALKKITDVPAQQWFIVFEFTGVYSKALKSYLQSINIPCMEENALKIKRNAPLKRGKSDPLDATMICEYAVEKLYKLKPQQASNQTVDKIKVLFSKRELLLKQKVALTISLKEQKIFLAEDLKIHLEKINNELIQTLESKIKTIEKLIRQYLKQDTDIYNKYTLAKSVVGIGFVTATLMICLTDNFTSKITARQFASFSGIAPFPNQSGGRIGRKKINAKGNKLMKKAISNCVQSAIKYDPFINQYYMRLLEKNKPIGVIYNNIKNKLIARIFSTIKRNTPYVKLTYQ